MAEPAPLASLSVTHVYYDPDDRLSLFCAYLALLPQALCVVYATLIYSTREAEIGLTFAGQLACEALNFALKRLIKEERPARIHGKGYGMPSSHAQFVAFWSVSLALFLLVRHNPPPFPKTATRNGKMVTVGPDVHRPWSVAERVALSLTGAVVAGLVSWSRIYLNYHTTRQVMAGTATGVVSALVWFAAVGVARQTGWLQWAIDIPLVRAFRIRDLLVEEDPCQAGWEKWVERQGVSDKNKPKTT